MSPLAAFITGLTTGGLTCFAVQGGLLVGIMARRDKTETGGSRWSTMAWPVAAFLVAKLLAYTLLGFGLGWLGDRIQIGITARIWLQVIAGLFMFVAGVRLIFPNWMRWLQFTPPASVRRFVRGNARRETLIAPAVLGVLTILIPCGTTQAIEVAAIASGSAFKAATLLFSFVLGTVPLFFIIGVLAKGTVLAQRRLAFAAAALVIGLSIYTLNGALVLVDSPYSIQNEAAAFRRVVIGADQEGSTANRIATINVLPNGYSPNELSVAAGQPVTLKLNPQGRLGCTSVFRIPKLNINTTLAPSGTTDLIATFPSPGRYTFTCGMGMYTGTINAI